MEKRTLAGLGKVWIEKKLDEIARDRTAPIECCTWQSRATKYDDFCLIVLGRGGRCLMKQFQRREIEACVSDEASRATMEKTLRRIVEFFCKK
jgi:hypothetical protein